MLHVFKLLIIILNLSFKAVKYGMYTFFHDDKMTYKKSS